METILDVHCHKMTCEDVSDPSSYEFEVTVSGVFTQQGFITACYQILRDGSSNHLNVIMAKAVWERVSEAEWTLAALQAL